MARKTAETAPKKPENDPNIVSIHEIAAYLDCATRTAEKYCDAGLVIRVGRGRYDLLQSVQKVVAHLRKQAALQVSDDGKQDQVAENIRFKAVQRRMSEIRLGQLEGSLMSMQEIEDSWSALVAANRQIVLSIPGRARTEIPDMTGHEQKILMEVCRSALTETALGEGKMPRIGATGEVKRKARS